MCNHSEKKLLTSNLMLFFIMLCNALAVQSSNEIPMCDNTIAGSATYFVSLRNG